MPCGCTLLGLSAIPTSHPLNKGMLGMHGNLGPNVKTNECDVLIAVGMRFDDRVTGKLETYAKQAKVIHLDIDHSEIDKNVKVDVPVLGNCKHTLAMLTQLIRENKHSEWIDSFAEYEKTEYEHVISKEIHPVDGALNMGEVVRAVSEASNNEAVLVTDVGQNQMMAARYFKYSKNRSIVTSGGLGTMGFGLPAAIGATFGCPDRTVCVFMGDGGLQMNIQELMTCVDYNLPVKVLIFNNGYLGMVRQLQEKMCGGRYSQTKISNPDFLKIAEAYGIKAKRVEFKDDIIPSLKEAFEHNGPYIIDFVIEPMEIL